MDIDLSVVLAGTINFFIFFFILRKFVFKPTMEMIESRKQEIETSFAKAKIEEDKIESLKAEQEDNIKRYKEDGQKLIDAYKIKAEKVYDSIIEDAKKEAETIRERAKQDIEREKRKAESEIKSQVIDLSLVLAEKALEKKIDEDEHKRLIDEFISKVGN
ncbi:MAG: F0F1 ATP synthase subunit B [Clostridium argentinense]|uniref:ATP synthase subunit b n=1 Tax=Clostridium faecium TaxID=2762223 RepID=A0ABR8YTQ3_9CLOT|nr:MULTISPECIES: F0F1 ATP synthase subunit B [Clostridium]MBD8047620.1 F0F1 ATP synthase subunit B [Clostridium faecium]MBS5823257.1 F0F1 ATP synthase subunit B [Clostridium argentinense]MDU1349649.1 F0F1 ATP synthase subunit B [Clostridium argentinense]